MFALQELVIVTELLNEIPTDQPLVLELPLLVTVTLATKPLPQLFKLTEQLRPPPPPLELDELELLELELLLDELELLELDELELELLDEPLPPLICPAEAVNVTRSSPEPSSLRSILSV